MIITFCGHSDFKTTEEYTQKLLTLLEQRIGDTPAELFLGGYGNFDSFAFECAKKYKEAHPSVSLIFVTPYMTLDYQRTRLVHEKKRYDSIIYPHIEDKPLKYAISYRNRYMVEQADLLICYLTHTWGGAYRTYRYARAKGKCILNLAEGFTD